MLALDKSTLDRLKRWLPPLRGLPTGHDELLPGRLAGLFEVRTQPWRRLDVLPEARAMLEGLLAGMLVLFARGYFAFEWLDELTTAGFFWLSQDGLFDALVWMGPRATIKSLCRAPCPLSLSGPLVQLSDQCARSPDLSGQ